MTVTGSSRAVWLVAGGLAFSAGLGPASASARGVGVSMPLYESPGGTVPAIVTAYGVPPGYGAAIEARGTAGAVASCRGEVWINRIRRSASRRCYLRLPLRRGSYDLVGRARLSRPSAAVIVRSGAGGRAIVADGVLSRGVLSPEEIEAIERCSNQTDRVWLTFDDGGSPTQVRRILATLAATNVRGRFFFTGAWGERNPGLVRRMRRDGHVLANHSYTHVPLSRAPAREVLRQIDRGIGAAISGPRLLRPPFGAGALTSRLRLLAMARGYRLCRWTVDTYAWRGVTASRMVERITIGDEMSPPVAAGGNILMHGTGRHTSTGLRRIIDAVRAQRLALEPLRRGQARSNDELRNDT